MEDTENITRFRNAVENNKFSITEELTFANKQLKTDKL